jgi:sugar/nucleoside kinase (ribokinase family)
MTEVVGLGPSLVDIGIELPHDQYQECQQILGVEPGGWSLIETGSELHQLFDAVGLESDQLSELQRRQGISIVAGGSVLGMLGAMPPERRGNSRLMTALAEQEGRLDPMSSFYMDAVSQVGLSHQYQLINGHNPVGFVLSSTATSEKILAMHPGVATELNTPYESTNGQPKLVIVDAYELRDGKLANMLDDIVMSGEFPIALSLGNHTILRDKLRERIRNYVETGKLFALCGNEEEFQRLFYELEEEQVGEDGFRQHPVKDQVPYVLLTRGPKGLSTHWDGHFADVPAAPIREHEIVNTAGAGDTAAGAFFNGILARAHPKETLERAAYLATNVLRVSGSMIVASD